MGVPPDPPKSSISSMALGTLAILASARCRTSCSNMAAREGWPKATHVCWIENRDSFSVARLLTPQLQNQNQWSVKLNKDHPISVEVKIASRNQKYNVWPNSVIPIVYMVRDRVSTASWHRNASGPPRHVFWPNPQVSAAGWSWQPWQGAVSETLNLGW